MKLLGLFGVTALAAVLLSNCQEGQQTDAPAGKENDGYVLATKNHLAPVGTRATVVSRMSLGPGDVTFTMSGQEVHGTLQQTGTTEKHFHQLTETSFRKLETTKSAEGKMTVNGQEQDAPPVPGPLDDVPVILELADGEWSASLESDDAPTPQQQEKLESLVQQFEAGEDVVMYGTTPRKVGDRWDVEAEALASFGGLSSLSGPFAMEFLGLEEFDGIECAVLKATFDVEGTMEKDDQPLAIQFKGEARIRRSLADQIDLKVEFNADMTIEGSPTPQMQMRVEAPMTMDVETKLERP